MYIPKRHTHIPPYHQLFGTGHPELSETSGSSAASLGQGADLMIHPMKFASCNACRELGSGGSKVTAFKLAGGSAQTNLRGVSGPFLGGRLGGLGGGLKRVGASSLVESPKRLVGFKGKPKGQAKPFSGA